MVGKSRKIAVEKQVSFKLLLIVSFYNVETKEKLYNFLPLSLSTVYYSEEEQYSNADEEWA